MLYGMCIRYTVNVWYAAVVTGYHLFIGLVTGTWDEGGVEGVKYKKSETDPVKSNFHCNRGPCLHK